MIKMFLNAKSRLFFSILCLLFFVLLEEAPAAEFADVKSLGEAAKPIHDVSGLILVVGHDQHNVFIVDVARTEIVRKFRLNARVNSEPVFSPAGRFAYLFSEDGWLARFDLSILKQVVMRQLKQRINSVAVSADGRFLLIAWNKPAAL